MIEKSLSEFKQNTEAILTSTITDEEIIKVAIHSGNAVIMSESEYKCLRGALKICLNASDGDTK